MWLCYLYNLQATLLCRVQSGTLITALLINIHYKNAYNIRLNNFNKIVSSKLPVAKFNLSCPNFTQVFNLLSVSTGYPMAEKSRLILH